jgi:hypothetical protein
MMNSAADLWCRSADSRVFRGVLFTGIGIVRSRVEHFIEHRLQVPEEYKNSPHWGTAA